MKFLRKPAAWYFEDKHQADHLGKKSLKAYLFSAGANGVRVFINIASVSILARLLMPEDFGYVAMAAVFVAAPKMMTGQALSMGIIQSTMITQNQLSGFFWICLGWTVFVTFSAFLCSPLVAWFFNEPALTGMVRMMSLIILFTGISTIPYALLNRRMQFGVIAGIDLLSGVISKLVAITLAFSGFGYWSLVFMPVSHEGIRSFFMFWVCTFRPRGYRIIPESKSLLKLGSILSITGIISSLANEMDRILIGKFLNPQILGIYSRSYALGEMPGKFIAWPLSKIAVSALSRLKHDPEKFQRFFLILSQAYFLVITPVMIWFYHSGDAIVLLILGDNFKEAVPVFKMLVFYFLFKNLVRPFEWLLTSTFETGSTTRQIYYWMGLKNLCFISGVVFGLPWGMAGIAIGISGTFLLFFLASIFLFSDSPYFNRIAFLFILMKIFAAGLISLLATIFTIRIMEDVYPVSHHVMALGSGFVIVMFFFGAFLCMPGSGIALQHVIHTLRQLKKQQT